MQAVVHRVSFDKKKWIIIDLEDCASVAVILPITLALFSLFHVFVLI